MTEPQNWIRDGQVMLYSSVKSFRRGDSPGVTGEILSPSMTLNLAERSVWCVLRLTASEEMEGKSIVLRKTGIAMFSPEEFGNELPELSYLVSFDILGRIATWANSEEQLFPSRK